MGSSQSSAVSSSITMMNQSITNVVNVNQNTAHATTISSNSFTINLGAPQVLLWSPPPGSNQPPVFSQPSSCKGCVFNLGQKITATQKVTLNAAITNKSDLQTQLKSALQQSADNATSSQQGALALSLNCQNSKTSINTSISNLVQNNITDETINSISGLVSSANSGIINMIGNNDGTVVNNPQEILTQQVVNLISNSLSANTSSTGVTTDASNSATATTTSKQEGLVDAIGGVISSIMTGYVLIILGVILCIGFVLYIFKDVIGGAVSTVAKNPELVAFGFGVRRILGFGRRRCSRR
jgi:hypothetical protein